MSNYTKVLDQLLETSPSAIVTLFTIELTDSSLYRFHNGTNEINTDIVWQGNTYVAIPIKVEGFELKSNGTIPRPTLTVSNVLNFSSTYLSNKDILGAKVSRYRTFAKYLDATNFTNGNPNADPTVYFPVDVYYVDRVSSENNIFIEYELSAAWDLQGVMLPRRTVLQNTCPWKYKGDECTWVPTSGKYFNKYDEPLADADAAQDACGKHLNSCKVRFGEDAVLPFGGFPGAGILRR